MSKQIPELTIIPTPTAGQESLIETVVARHDTYATSRMTLAQIFTLGSISGAIKSALDTLSGLIAGNTSSINTLSSTKLNIAWGTRTGLTAKAVVATDASGNEVLITGTVWQQIGFDASNNPVAITPTVDIAGLTSKTTPIGADQLIISDSEASWANKKVTIDSIRWDGAMFWDGSDGDLTISSWTTTIPFSANGYVEKNYNNLTITGGTLTFSSPATNGSVAYIKVKGRFKMTWGTISVVWMWAAWQTLGYTILRSNWPWAGWAGSTWTAWTAYQDAGWTTIFNGAGWGNSPSAFGWSPWRWGWILIIEADEWELTTGTLDASGQAATDGTAPSQNQSCAWAGWGWAGTIVRRARIIVTDTGTYKVDGWTGANALHWWSTGSTGSADKWGGGGWSYGAWWVGWATPANGANSTWWTWWIKWNNHTDWGWNIATWWGGWWAGRIIKN